MIVGLGIAIGLAQINGPYPEVAILHHAPTVFAIVIAPLLLRRWPITDASLLCIVLFLLLHTLGGRYTYTDTPYDAWAETIFGTTINEIFGWERNHYDRLVHFAFGVLAFVPFSEWGRQYLGLSLHKAALVALLWVFSIGALYEIFEWGLTLVAGGATADAYNGQQGDIWDAQKDMALAALGALIMWMLLAFRSRRAVR
ncbi:MAG: DUF2238 domain-containing protein [Pseudomonadota bacterium]